VVALCDAFRVSDGRPQLLLRRYVRSESRLEVMYVEAYARNEVSKGGDGNTGTPVAFAYIGDYITTNHNFTHSGAKRRH